MTVPGKGGRPCLVKDPHVSAKVVSIMANGGTQAEAARATGVSAQTAHRIAKAHAEDIEALRSQIQAKVGRMVLEGTGKATRARLADASDPGSKTGAHSYRVVMEAAGVVGGPRDVNVHGDLNIDTSRTSVHVQAVMAGDPAKLREDLERMREELGIG